jgi:hypothetical protein
MYSADGNHGSSAKCPGWLMTAVAPWGENSEDAYDQGLVELGLGDSRLIEMKGAMLPLGFGATPPQPLPMGSLVECHLATAYAWNGSSACAGVAWAACVTPEGDNCAIVATVSTEMDYEETTLLLRRHLQRKLASRDLEVLSFDVAVDEVTAAADHSTHFTNHTIAWCSHWHRACAKGLNATSCRTSSKTSRCQSTCCTSITSWWSQVQH